MKIDIIFYKEKIHKINYTSQSLDPTVCQQLSCGYRCFMGLHVNYNLSHHYNALLRIIIASLQCITCNCIVTMQSNVS